MEYDPGIHSLQCPKCRHGMEEETLDGITIDRCTHCEGLWFDGDEAHQLKSLEGSEALDSGEPHVGWIFDSNDSRQDIIAATATPSCMSSPSGCSPLQAV